MKKLILVSAIFASAALLYFAIHSQDVAAAGATSAAKSCGTCHKGSRSFAGRDSDELAADIRAMLEGEFAHPPVTLEDSSEEALLELAKQLTPE